MESKSKVLFKGSEWFNSHANQNQWLKSAYTDMPELISVKRNPNPIITMLVKEGKRNEEVYNRTKNEKN